MATPSLQLGSGNWAVKSDSLLGYALPQGKYVPREFTVTRATTATRVNETGLVQLVPYNFLSWSEMFSDASWNKIASTITANTTTAPNGTLTADKLVENSTNSNHWVFQSNTGSFQSITASCYFKKSERDWGFIRVRTNIDDRYAYFNLNNGTIGTVNAQLTATIQDVGNGWYRCVVTTTAPTTSVNPIVFGMSNADNTTSYLGDGTSGLFIWGAQLNEGALNTYQPTTTRLNIPRIDYSTGSAALLVEPQRTNLALRSEEFDSISWIKDVGVSVNANFATSPSGIQNADKVNFASNNLAIYRVGTAVGAHKFSVYLKGEGANIGKQIQLIIGNVGGTTNVTLTDQWVRYETDATSATYAGVGKVGLTQADSVLIWGAQLEAGSYSTSYIPTTSAAVTRNADSVSKTGISSLIGQQEGTVFIDVVVNGCQNISANLINTERNTTASFGIIYLKASSQIGAFIYYGGSYIGTSGASIAIGQRAKIAFAYKSGNTTLYVNGVQISTDATTFTFPASLDDIFIGDPVTYFAYQESITNNATALFKTRLTNSELQSLTTL
jgi:hypothetical protein